ncbi:hypothetical protein Tco_0682392 [Tanacetum coccineum]|uniref:Uncharacterized protein n=1 Tax=Tanacetum coccineum TaxID=301880 RepID=A0ABQ4XSN6_9ASTR
MVMTTLWLVSLFNNDLHQVPWNELDLPDFTTNERVHLLINDKSFNHDEYWSKIGQPTLTNPRTLLIEEPLMQVVHKLIVGALVHRLGSREICQKRDLWMMSALEESRGINLAWVIVDHLYKHASVLKESSLIFAGEFDKDNDCLLRAKRVTPQPREEMREQRREPSGLNSSWGDCNASLSEIEHRDV